MNYGSAMTGSAHEFKSTAAPFIVAAFTYIWGSAQGRGLYGETTYQEGWPVISYANSRIRRKNASCSSANTKLTEANTVYAPAGLQTWIKKLMAMVANGVSPLSSM